MYNFLCYFLLFYVQLSFGMEKDKPVAKSLQLQFQSGEKLSLSQREYSVFSTLKNMVEDCSDAEPIDLSRIVSEKSINFLLKNNLFKHLACLSNSIHHETTQRKKAKEALNIALKTQSLIDLSDIINTADYLDNQFLLKRSLDVYADKLIEHSKVSSEIPNLLKLNDIIKSAVTKKILKKLPIGSVLPLSVLYKKWRKQDNLIFECNKFPCITTISKNGNRIASLIPLGKKRKLLVWDLENQKVLYTLKDNECNKLILSKDGRFCFCDDSRNIYKIAVDAGIGWCCDHTQINNSLGKLIELALIKDDRFLVTAFSCEDDKGQVIVWKVKKNEKMVMYDKIELNNVPSLTGFRFLDNDIIFCNGNNGRNLHKIILHKSGKEFKKYSKSVISDYTNEGDFKNFLVTQSGKFIYSINLNGQIIKRDFENESVVVFEKHVHPKMSYKKAILCCDNRILLTYCAHVLNAWDAQNGKFISEFSYFYKILTISPGGEYIVFYYDPKKNIVIHSLFDQKKTIDLTLDNVLFMSYLHSLYTQGVLKKINNASDNKKWNLLPKEVGKLLKDYYNMSSSACKIS